MIRGIGVDAVYIPDLQRMLETQSPIVSRLFTRRELAAAEEREHKVEYLAERWAAKEAVFKAVAPAATNARFDLRIVETLSDEDGSPYICLSDSLRPILSVARIDTLHISLTAERDYATAFVIAEALSSAP